MKKALSTLLLFCSIIVNAQQVPVEIRILALENRPLSYAHIIITNRHLGTITDTSGIAKLHLYSGDTLFISHLGYLDREYLFTSSQISNASLEIRLIPKVIEISGISVHVLPATYKGFKEAVANLKLDKEPEIADMNFPFISQFVPGPSSGFGITAMGPVQILYNLFSKEVKSKKKLKTLIAADKKRYQVQNIYNQELITQLTGISDKMTIDRFIKFCALSDDFILNSVDYDLYLAILDCYQLFKTNE